MTTPENIIDKVSELVQEYFERHIVDERDDAIARLREAESTAVFSVRQVAEDTTGADRRAAQEAREQAVASAELVGTAEDIARSVAQAREDREAAELSATESAESAESARQYAESAAAGLTDGEVTRVKLAPEVVSEIESKATEADLAGTVAAIDTVYSPLILARPTVEEVDSRIEDLIGSAPEHLDTLGELADLVEDNTNMGAALTKQISGKAKVDHKHTRADITDLPEVSAEAVSRGLVQRHSDGHITVPVSPVGASDASSKEYVDEEVATRATPDYVNQQVATRATPDYVNQQVATRATPAQVDTKIEARTPEIIFMAAGTAPDQAPAGQLILEYEE